MKNIAFEGIFLSLKGEKLINSSSFDINQGDAILFSGDNGKGKTSLFKAMLGLLKKPFEHGGKIEFCSMQKSQICYAPQADIFSFYSAVDELVYSLMIFAKISKIDAYNEANNILNMYFNLSQKEDFRNVPISGLSGGQKKILSFLLALSKAKFSKLLLLDEPLNNLDDENIMLISDLLKKTKIENPLLSMIIISHCKIFPFIDYTLTLSNKQLIKEPSKTNYSACFGAVNSNGYYVL